MKTRISLTIAGSDTGGGAGIQADIKTMSSLGVYATSVITSLTSQNTKEVSGIFSIPSDFVKLQLETVFRDIDIDSVKIGMLGDCSVMEVISTTLKDVGAKNIVVDTVMVAKSGDRLLSEDSVSCLKEYILPIADIITPNLPEACNLLGIDEIDTVDNMVEATYKLLNLGSKAVLLKGGHLSSLNSQDVFNDGKNIHLLPFKKIITTNTHGTGCTLSSAIASFLARDFSLKDSIIEAQNYVYKAIEGADTLRVGKGCGPIKHFYRWW